MKTRELPKTAPRQDRLLRERIHDTYRLRGKLPDPARCPECQALYTGGRWIWSESPMQGAAEVTCPACRRIQDRYPAGEVHIRGGFARDHWEEIRNLIANIARAQSDEHPQKRVIAMEEGEQEFLVTTTDIHLPHQIGHALHDAWEGELDVHYDEEGYSACVEWRRDH